MKREFSLYFVTTFVWLLSGAAINISRRWWWRGGRKFEQKMVRYRVSEWGSLNESGYIKSATKLRNEFVSLLWNIYCILKIYIISLPFIRTQGSKEVAPKLTNCGPLSLSRMCGILCSLKTVWRKIRAKSLTLMVLWQGEMKAIDPWSQQYSRNRAWS